MRWRGLMFGSLLFIFRFSFFMCVYCWSLCFFFQLFPPTRFFLCTIFSSHNEAPCLFLLPFLSRLPIFSVFFVFFMNYFASPSICYLFYLFPLSFLFYLIFPVFMYFVAFSCSSFDVRLPYLYSIYVSFP